MNMFSGERQENAENRLRVSFKFSENMETSIVGDTISDLITGLEGLGNAKFINEFASKMDLSEEQFGRLDKMMLDTRNDSEIERYLKMRDFKVNNVDYCEKVLLELGNIWLMVYFSLKNQGNYFKQIEEAVIASENNWAIYSFSKAPGADLKKIKKVLWESEGKGYCLEFYCDHKADKDLILPEDVKFLEELAIKNKEESYICKVAESVEGVDLDKLIDVIVEVGSEYYILRFARIVAGTDRLTKLQDAIIKTGDASRICEFGNLEGVNLRLLYMALRRTGDKYYIRKFRNDTGYRAFW